MTQKNLCSELEAFHDGELTREEILSATAHMDGCPACRTGLAGLRALDELLRPCAASADISSAVMTRVAALDPGPAQCGRSLAGWWKVPALALASCAIYVLCSETGLLPARRSQLPAALSADKEALKLSTLLFGRPENDREQLLAMLFEGGEK